MINGNWYYFKADGYIAMNEFVQGWWLNKDGWYAKSKSYTIDGKKYTFDKKGYTK